MPVIKPMFPFARENMGRDMSNILCKVSWEEAFW
jgi:hypothetical protein